MKMKKLFYELLDNDSRLKVFYSFENNEWETKSWYKLYQVNVDSDKLETLKVYLEACITDDGTSFILGSIKKDLIPSGILTPIKSQLEIKSEALELLIW